jgi:hypothetical protein
MSANYSNGGPSRHHFRFSIDVYKAETFEFQSFLGYRISPPSQSSSQYEPYDTANHRLQPCPTKQLEPAPTDPWNARTMRFLGFCVRALIGLL